MADRPKIGTLLGVLFCLFGLMALVSIGIEANRGIVSLNFAALLLPVGIGLLRNRERSRKISAFILAATDLAAIIAASSIPFTRWVMNVRINEHVETIYGGYLVATLLVASAIIFYLYVAITMPNVVQFYRSQSRRSAT